MPKVNIDYVHFQEIQGHSPVIEQSVPNTRVLSTGFKRDNLKLKHLIKCLGICAVGFLVWAYFLHDPRWQEGHPICQLDFSSLHPEFKLTSYPPEGESIYQHAEAPFFKKWKTKKDGDWKSNYSWSHHAARTLCTDALFE